MIALVSFLVMIGLMLFNVPIALCTGFAAITGIVMSSNISYLLQSAFLSLHNC